MSSTLCSTGTGRPRYYRFPMQQRAGPVWFPAGPRPGFSGPGPRDHRARHRSLPAMSRPPWRCLPDPVQCWCRENHRENLPTSRFHPSRSMKWHDSISPFPGTAIITSRSSVPAIRNTVLPRVQGRVHGCRMAPGTVVGDFHPALGGSGAGSGICTGDYHRDWRAGAGRAVP